MTKRITAEQARYLADNYEPDYTFRHIQDAAQRGYKSVGYSYRNTGELEIARQELVALGFHVKPAPIHHFRYGEQIGVSDTELIVSWGQPS